MMAKSLFVDILIIFSLRFLNLDQNCNWNNWLQVDRRSQHEVGEPTQHVQGHEMGYIDHRAQWSTPQQQQQQQQQQLQQTMMMHMTPATHQLIHGSPPGTQQLVQVIHRDEADDGYRTNSSSSSCSDGHSPQMSAESPPPGETLKRSSQIRNLLKITNWVQTLL